MGASVKVLFGLLFAVALGFFVGSIQRNGPFSESTAAWVQAFGTIGAVFGAAWIAARQSQENLRREERDRAAERAERLRQESMDRASAVAVAQRVILGLGQVLEALRRNPRFFRTFAPDAVDGIYSLTELDGFPLYIIRDRRCTEVFLQLRRRIRFARHIIALQSTNEVEARLQKNVATLERVEKNSAVLLEKLKTRTREADRDQ
ncbi:MAG TPA: hypothetical protein VFE13_08965 [Caulobacteraceae bacterium]|jgi:hypothetical protein|nr:hypothetical protein [Caulobacteraceae bacterium]